MSETIQEQKVKQVSARVLMEVSIMHLRLHELNMFTQENGRQASADDPFALAIGHVGELIKSLKRSVDGSRVVHGIVGPDGRPTTLQ